MATQVVSVIQINNGPDPTPQVYIKEDIQSHSNDIMMNEVERTTKGLPHHPDRKLKGQLTQSVSNPEIIETKNNNLLDDTALKISQMTISTHSEGCYSCPSCPPSPRIRPVLVTQSTLIRMNDIHEPDMDKIRRSLSPIPLSPEVRSFINSM